MKHTIANEKITFVSDSFGVEPWSLVFNDERREEHDVCERRERVNYFWHTPEGEKLGTAVCFPVIGAFPGNTYLLDGKEYPMSMHGFAQDYDFAVAEQSANRIVYELTDTTETYQQFPWQFRFQVVYSVEDTTLKTEYRILNRDNKPLFCSVAGHPRFACPIDGADASRFDDYYIAFEKPEQSANIVKSYGPVSVVEQFLSGDGKKIRLDYRMFEKGCFCFKPFNSRSCTLGSEKSSRSLTLRADTMTHFQVWTAVDAPYIALEPLYGSITSLPPRPEDRNWKERKGTLQIKPGEEFVCAYNITIRR
jgi:galactose mutarotase-like enzyme